MNRILLEGGEIGADGTAVLSGPRAAHVRDVLRARVGDDVRVGAMDGPVGTARVLEVATERVRLAVTLDAEPPPPRADLLLAVPRPKVLRRLWPQLAALGVGRIVLLNAGRVESGYFHTHWLRESEYRPLLVEGLSQAGTTRLPEVRVRRRFRPFVEDELDALFPTRWRLLAHPGPATAVPVPGGVARPRDRERLPRPLLAVGPEGGWTDYEIEQFLARGFAPFSLGERVLRSDTACVALLAVLGHAVETAAGARASPRGAARGSRAAPGR
jgi:RsmE family RNA methyltransferase